MDFGVGFQPSLSSGTRSSILRVLAISWSNSGSRQSMIGMDFLRSEKFPFYSPPDHRAKAAADQVSIV
jgi:hypothetical protein